MHYTYERRRRKRIMIIKEEWEHIAMYSLSRLIIYLPLHEKVAGLLSVPVESDESGFWKGLRGRKVRAHKGNFQTDMSGEQQVIEVFYSVWVSFAARQIHAECSLLRSFWNFSTTLEQRYAPQFSHSMAKRQCEIDDRLGRSAHLPCSS